MQELDADALGHHEETQWLTEGSIGGSRTRSWEQSLPPRLRSPEEEDSCF